MVVPFRLVFKNLFATRFIALRSLLTLASLVVAIFLLCFLTALVHSLEAGARAASSNRLIVQSAVSLFVDLPLSYQAKIEGVEGVVPGSTTKFNWFGGYYRDPSNFFGQFGVDPGRFLEIYPEVQIVKGDKSAWLRNRTGCVIGSSLARRFGWKVGDQVPLIGTIYSRQGAWEFQVEGIYHSKSASVDNSTLFFDFEYLRESLESGAARGPKGCGVYTIKLEPGARPEGVMAAVDGLFANGPQRVQTTTEAEFQRQFVSMMGNIPQFIASIGGGVLFAIVLAVLNTMLMAGRERTRDLGILKALGFTDATAFLLLLLESLLLCGLGGLMGVGLAVWSEPMFLQALGTFFPGYRVTPQIAGMGLALALATGLVAGIVPAWRASKLRTVDALRMEA